MLLLKAASPTLQLPSSLSSIADHPAKPVFGHVSGGQLEMDRRPDHRRGGNDISQGEEFAARITGRTPPADTGK